MTPFRTLLDTTAPDATILVRILVGAVFLSEGIQKFLFSAALGVGRFEKIGIPSPAIAAPFVGSLEVICGALLIVGLLTRVASLLLLLNISVAILSTKIPILLGTGFWGFSLPKMTSYGFWSMAHEARADFCMFLSSAFLLIVGGGGWSLDRMLARK
jgi:putative oxidoreductase